MLKTSLPVNKKSWKHLNINKFSLFYLLTFVLWISCYKNLALFQIKATLEVRHLFEGRPLLVGCACFAVDTQRCGVYQREASYWDHAIIRGNTVIIYIINNNLQCPLYFLLSYPLFKWLFSLLKFVNNWRTGTLCTIFNPA